MTGHVDGVARIVARKDRWHGAFRDPPPRTNSRNSSRPKSAALDGTSLTVNEVSGNRFTILLIPHTLAGDDLGEGGLGDPLNIEVDLMARYAARLEGGGLAGETSRRLPQPPRPLLKRLEF